MFSFMGGKLPACIGKGTRIDASLPSAAPGVQLERLLVPGATSAYHGSLKAQLIRTWSVLHPVVFKPARGSR